MSSNHKIFVCCHNTHRDKTVVCRDDSFIRPVSLAMKLHTKVLKAAANLLADKLRSGPASMDDLRKVQARREWPTRLIQAMQVFIHRRVVTGATSGRQSSLPLVFRLLKWFPVLRQIPARFIGVGPRPENYCRRGR